MTGVCRFCGCTDLTPCLFGDGQACGWVTEDGCSNPACVEKAYNEAKPRAEDLMEKLELVGALLPGMEHAA